MVSSSSDNQSEQLQLNLLDNALDSLLSAAEAVQRNEGPRSLKEAVLHLGNGIELLVKARLAREHWSLIFSNTDQASYDKLTDAEFTSVDFPRRLHAWGKSPKFLSTKLSFPISTALENIETGLRTIQPP